MRDRILQTIVNAAVHPITEFQADHNSFAYRPKRSATQAVSLVYCRLNQLGRNKQGNRGAAPAKVSFKRYKDFVGNKIRQRGRLLNPSDSKRRRKYDYNYWIAGNQESTSEQPFTLHSYNRIINVDIAKCFDNINHSSIIRFYPLGEKYRFLLKAWLRASIVGKKTVNAVTVNTWRPLKGVPQGSVLGPTVANVVLDGLETSLFEGFPSHFKRTVQEVDLIEKATGTVATSDQRRSPVRLHFIRYADDILIFGKGSSEMFETIYDRLTFFLEERGLSLKPTKASMFIFRPGAHFEFLGFQFHYPNPKSKKMQTGKATRVNYYDLVKVMRKQTSSKQRSGLLLTIRRKSMNRINQNLREVLNTSNLTFSVKELVRRYNSFLRGTVNYFGLTSSIRNQLKILDYRACKRFRRLMLQKFSSKPKMWSHVRSHYYTEDWRIKDIVHGGETQLKVADLQPYGNVPLQTLMPNKQVIKANVYLDLTEWDKYFLKLGKTSMQQKLRQRRELSTKDIRLALLTSQGGKCSICKGAIKSQELHNSSYAELDHSPRLHDLKRQMWLHLLNQSGLTLEDTKKARNSTRDQLEKAIWFNYLTFLKSFKDLPELISFCSKWVLERSELRIVHKECNREDGKFAIKESPKQRRHLQEHSSKELYQHYLSISKRLTKVVQSTYQLSDKQRQSTWKSHTDTK